MVVFSACKKNEEITIDKPRPLTEADRLMPAPQKEKSSSSYAYTKPSTWNEVAPTGFRKINFSTGSDTEIYLSESRGDVLSNANRWLGQFGNAPAEDLNAFKSMRILGHDGYLVEAVGDFKGFGASSAKANYKLTGVIVDVGGVLVTVKMTGPKEEVEQQMSGFMQFCTSFRPL